MWAADIICETATCAKPALTRSTLPRVSAVLNGFTALKTSLRCGRTYYFILGIMAYLHTQWPQRPSATTNDHQLPTNSHTSVRKRGAGCFAANELTTYFLQGWLSNKRTIESAHTNHSTTNDGAVLSFVGGWLTVRMPECLRPRCSSTHCVHTVRPQCATWGSGSLRPGSKQAPGTHCSG